jgi:hypothetical protein
MKTGIILTKINHLKSILLLLLLIVSQKIVAQDKLVPVNYSFDIPADFRQYEGDVIKCINWLAVNPRTFKPKERLKTEDFLVKWIYGSPYVNVVVEPYIMKLSSKNADLLLSFMFGYTLYQLEHLGDKNLVPANIAGISRLINDYQLNLSSFKKDPLIEKTIELEKEGKLTEWLQPQLGQKNL